MNKDTTYDISECEKLLRDAFVKRGLTSEQAACVYVYRENARFKIGISGMEWEAAERLVPILVESGLMTQPVMSPERLGTEFTLGIGKSHFRSLASSELQRLEAERKC